MRPKLIQYLETRLGEADYLGNEVNFECPFCSTVKGTDSNGKKLGVNRKTGAWHCFSCDSGGGSVRQLLRDLNNGFLSVEDVAAMVGDDTVVSPGRRKMASTVYKVLNDALHLPEVSETLNPEPLPAGSIPLFQGDGLELRRVRDFFLNRKSPYTRKQTERIIRKYGLLYLPTTAKYERPDRRTHMIIPVCMDGAVVWYTTRATDPDAKIKSLNPKQRPGYRTKEHCLLGYDQCAGKGTVAVVEGPFSMFAFDSLSVTLRRTTGAVALMGTTVSGFQVDLFRRLAATGTKRFVVATEPDKAMFRDKLARRLSAILPTSILPLPSGSDPDDEKPRLAQLLRDAVPYTKLSSAELTIRAAMTQRQK